MFSAPRILLCAAVAGTLLAFPATSVATDVDGPDDCQRLLEDWGDAPEGADAYAGVPGRFPTCSFGSPPGTQTFDCAPVSTVPGPTGFVRHLSVDGVPNYWLGCPPAGVGPLGIDSEPDGKFNATGAALSDCADNPVDCIEPAFGLNFGQDECFGSNDAGLVAPQSFFACSPSRVVFRAYNCSADTVHVFLNVLVDWNKDGDWNDNLFCDPAAGSCALEWAVKNAPVALAPGCNTIDSPTFLAGPLETEGWMRLTISDNVVTDDFPWRGSEGLGQNSALRRGETEDYPIRILPPTSGCPEYQDWGDAPEEFQAYPGIIGHFPTCAIATGPGTQELDCAPISTPPGATGFVRHVRNDGDPAVWLGCTAVPPGSIDSETDGKSNDNGGPASMCAQIPVDCVEAAFGMSFGQDECYGDADAGIAGPVTFTACDTTRVKLDLFNCGTQTVIAYLNVLVDWNRDGDWNDNFLCTAGANPVCAYEWPVKNLQIGLPPGCTTFETPTILAGPFEADGWMRVTLTLDVVSDDFPWSGSLVAGGPDYFPGGETEDYPITIEKPDPCEFGYEDFGDAPEGFAAYASGTPGAFPTCLAPGPVGTLTLDCGVASGTPPGPAGYVRHLAGPADPDKFWLGCGSAADPTLGIDSEIDGKTNIGGAATSRCNPAQAVDCVEPGVPAFSQDECFGDLDAALGSFLTFGACSTEAVTFNAYSCSPADQQVFLNILIDWNQDGDWNDNAICRGNKRCAPEWAVKNAVIDLAPGCGTYTSPLFQVADSLGRAWMRITLTREPVLDDFPWNGSAGEPNGYYPDGESEDYLIGIRPSTVDVETGASGGLWLAPLTPNPSRDLTMIRFSLPSESDVTLQAFDVNGRRVRTFADRRMTAGRHTLQWDFRDDAGRALPAGIYLVTLRVGADVMTNRVIRIR